MEEKILIDTGLSLPQAKIYLFLIGNGLAPAKVISNKTGIGRALTYKVLNELIDIQLVEERNDIRKISLLVLHILRDSKD